MPYRRLAAWAATGFDRLRQRRTETVALLGALRLWLARASDAPDDTTVLTRAELVAFYRTGGRVFPPEPAEGAAAEATPFRLLLQPDGDLVLVVEPRMLEAPDFGIRWQRFRDEVANWCARLKRTQQLIASAPRIAATGLTLVAAVGDLGHYLGFGGAAAGSAYLYALPLVGAGGAGWCCGHGLGWIVRRRVRNQLGLR